LSIDKENVNHLFYATINCKFATQMSDKVSIDALIRLVDDPDEQVFVHVRDQLLNFGTFALPFLQNSYDILESDLIFQSRIEQIIHDIQFEALKNRLEIWVNSEDKDLIEAAIIVAKYQYPNFDESLVFKAIDQLINDCWLELNNRQTAFEKVKIINKIFFEFHGFKGDTVNYSSPLNSYINAVIESRSGNPLSLSILYSVLAQALNIPIYGVNLPNHFILAYMDEYGSRNYSDKKNDYGVLFYINPFSKGTLIDENSIQKFIVELNLNPQRSFFEPCSNSTIISRMLTNLIAGYEQIGNQEKVDELSILRSMV
jgi:regulator of sirC expression with transglutaminase-like and TPR domain